MIDKRSVVSLAAIVDSLNTQMEMTDHKGYRPGVYLEYSQDCRRIRIGLIDLWNSAEDGEPTVEVCKSRYREIVESLNCFFKPEPEALPHLKWKMDEPGIWCAFSKHHDEGTPFEYRISMSKLGSFCINQTDAEIMPPEDSDSKFASLEQAKIVCQTIEDQPL